MYMINCLHFFVWHTSETNDCTTVVSNFLKCKKSWLLAFSQYSLEAYLSPKSGTRPCLALKSGCWGVSALLGRFFEAQKALQALPDKRKQLLFLKVFGGLPGLLQ